MGVTELNKVKNQAEIKLNEVKNQAEMKLNKVKIQVETKPKAKNQQVKKLNKDKSQAENNLKVKNHLLIEFKTVKNNTMVTKHKVKDQVDKNQMEITLKDKNQMLKEIKYKEVKNQPAIDFKDKMVVDSKVKDQTAIVNPTESKDKIKIIQTVR